MPPSWKADILPALATLIGTSFNIEAGHRYDLTTELKRSECWNTGPEQVAETPPPHYPIHVEAAQTRPESSLLT